MDRAADLLDAINRLYAERPGLEGLERWDNIYATERLEDELNDLTGMYDELAMERDLNLNDFRFGDDGL